MCIILLAYRAHPLYKLIVAANRDEFYARPTMGAHFWDDAPHVLAGRDARRGGTWLGITRGGRFAAVTNYRDPSASKKGAPSRGHLVSDFLISQESSAEYLGRIKTQAQSYQGFNLFAGDARGLLGYLSNRDEAIRELRPGIYGLSNHLLDTPWPKVARGKEALAALAHRGAPLEPESLFRILADRAEADDNLLPQTGVGLQIERALSPLFISTEVYGTRSSTLLLIDGRDSVTFIERTFSAGRQEATDAVFQFTLEQSLSAS